MPAADKPPTHGDRDEHEQHDLLGGPGFEFGLLPHAQNNVSGCLCRMDDSRPSEHGPLLYLSVEGRLDAAIRAAREGGGRVVRDKQQIGPHGHRAVIVDTEGNRIALHSQQA
jgi:uncharacterized protein